MPNTECWRLFNAKRLERPPLCSKKAQKSREEDEDQSSHQPFVLLHVEFAHLPTQIDQGGRANDVHEQVGVAGVRDRHENERDRDQRTDVGSESWYAPASIGWNVRMHWGKPDRSQGLLGEQEVEQTDGHDHAYKYEGYCPAMVLTHIRP